MKTFLDKSSVEAYRFLFGQAMAARGFDEADLEAVDDGDLPYDYSQKEVELMWRGFLMCVEQAFENCVAGFGR